ncbi:MAG TPA: MBL fold metallo-hydrolase [Anaerolineales bacterium]|nr:MBL fold metallo-hydrolase [Anaerolineales bacterium]
MPLELFPGFWGYAYLVLVDLPGSPSMQVLIDSGSGLDSSNEHLEAGLQAVSEVVDLPVGLPDLTHVLITHGHIDHFGGLSYIRPRSQAEFGVHELDWRIVANYEERLVVAARRLEGFLIEAGINPERRSAMLDLYQLTKGLYRSVDADFTYEACGMRVGPFELLHVPGHCAGHVVIRLDDVLFSGDHILSEISPHQSPERITLSTGLSHYLHSLSALRSWGQGIELVLGGHRAPVDSLEQRIAEIESLHHQRLNQVLDILRQPGTVSDVSQALFGKVHGYNVLLAVEEAGAHVEYLYQHGRLAIENLSEVENNPTPIPIVYRLLSGPKCSEALT